MGKAMIELGLDRLSSLTIDNHIELYFLAIDVHMPPEYSIDLYCFLLSGSH